MLAGCGFEVPGTCYLRKQAAVHSSDFSCKVALGHQPKTGMWSEVPDMLSGDQAAVHSSDNSCQEPHGHQPKTVTWSEVLDLLAGEQAAVHSSDLSCQEAHGQPAWDWNMV